MSLKREKNLFYINQRLHKKIIGYLWDTLYANGATKIVVNTHARFPYVYIGR